MAHPRARQGDAPAITVHGPSISDAHPSRPSSPLGFHPNPEARTSTPCAAPEAISQAPLLSRSLSPDAGTPLSVSLSSPSVSSSSPPISPSPSPHTPPSLAPSFTEKIVVGASTLASCSESNQFESPYAHSPEEQQTSPDPAPTAPPPPITTIKSPTSPRSVSRLCFPFVTTRSKPKPKPVPPPRPPPRHKHSSLAPSPLSPFCPDRPAPSQQRHRYPERGRSRLALDQVKAFWATKEERWKQQASPGSDLVPSLNKPSASDHPAPYESEGLDHDTKSATETPLIIHPRRGDIQALRDPYCVDMDRYFVNFSVWTISKMLWMLDLHKMAASRIRTRGKTPVDDDPSDSESDYDTSASTTGFNSDSDATLVESESENDLPRLALIKSTPTPTSTSTSTHEVIHQFSDPEGGKCRLALSNNQSTIRARRRPSRQHSPFAASKVAANRPDWPLTVYLKGRPHTSDYDSWATNWYHRWEILIDLSRRDWDGQHALSTSWGTTITTTTHTYSGHITQPRPASKGILGRRFFISGSGRHLDEEDHWIQSDRITRISL